MLDSVNTIKSGSVGIERSGWGWPLQNKEEGQISKEKKWNQIRVKSVLQKLFISGNYFSESESYLAKLLESHNEQWWERAAVKNGGVMVPVSVPEPNTVHPTVCGS